MFVLYLVEGVLSVGCWGEVLGLVFYLFLCFVGLVCVFCFCVFLCCDVVVISAVYLLLGKCLFLFGVLVCGVHLWVPCALLFGGFYSVVILFEGGCFGI